MTVLDIIHDIAPQFTDDAKNSRFILYATPQVDPVKFGDVYDLALAYLSAHLLEMASRNGGSIAGIVDNIIEGNRTLGYVVPTAADVDLAMTSYGVEFTRLKKMYITSAMVITGSTL